MRSAIAGGRTERVDYETLTGKIAPVWQRFPRGRHFGTVLEIGAGYGRIPLYLARERGVDLVDVLRGRHLRTMLERFVEYRDQFAPAPESRLYPICVSADALPLEDDSVDLAITSAVFLHMGKRLRPRRRRRDRAHAEAGRRLRLRRLLPERIQPDEPAAAAEAGALPPAALHEVLDRGEVESLLVESGLAAKAGGSRSSRARTRSCRNGSARAGPARAAGEQRSSGPPSGFDGVLAESFLVYSHGLVA